MITEIHKSDDYQSNAYTVGRNGCHLIERFNINGQYCPFPRIRVHLDGRIVELDEIGLAIYEDTN
jgi:hypothetical protein